MIPLPEPNARWTARHKANLVRAIQEKQISLEQARKKYALSEDEVRSWVHHFEEHGRAALKTTYTQKYR